MIIILTGGIGCGKSTATEWFKKCKWEIIDADKISHCLLKTNTFEYDRIVKYFVKEKGLDILNKRTIDRKKLANIVFNNEDYLNILNEWVHDGFGKEMERRINYITKNNPAKNILVDVPLLFESKSWLIQNLHKYYFTLCITCDEKNQLQRLKSRGYTDEEIKNRLKFQLSLKEKESKSDYVIENNGDVGSLYNKLVEFIGELKIKALK